MSAEKPRDYHVVNMYVDKNTGTLYVKVPIDLKPGGLVYMMVDLASYMKGVIESGE